MAQLGKLFSQTVCIALKLLLDIYPFAWHLHDVNVRMACKLHKWGKFDLSHSKVVVKTAT